MQLRIQGSPDFPKTIKEKKITRPSLLRKLVSLELKIVRIPRLSSIEKAKLDHALALVERYCSN